MQGTAEFHHQITDPLLPQADPVLHDAAALDTTIDVLNPQPPLIEYLVGQVLLQCELLAAGFLGRHEDLHLRERKRQEAQILQQPAPGRERVGSGFRNAQIMGTAAIGLAQKEDRKAGIHEQDIFGRVVFLLPAITFLLFHRVVGADDESFRPVMGKRGEPGAATRMGEPGADSSFSGTTTVAASASETPRRWARAARERAGASPRARSAVSNAGNRTWIH